jgi:hypothetical protein
MAADLENVLIKPLLTQITIESYNLNMQPSVNCIHEIIHSFYDEGLLSLLIGHLRPRVCKGMNLCI